MIRPKQGKEAMASEPQIVGDPGVENSTHKRVQGDARTNEELEELTGNHDKNGVRFFLQDTTLHGAKYLFVNNVFRRVIWIVAVISCFVFGSYQVYSSLTDFYEHPFHTILTTETAVNENKFSFPAVTLCNLNPLNKRRFRLLFNEVYHETPTKENIDIKLEGLSHMIRRSKEVSTEEFKKRHPKLFKRAESEKEMIKSRQHLSHQIEDMLLPSSSDFTSCSINGMPCKAKNFTKKESATYGQCYTFNSLDGDEPLLNATLGGRNSGLKLRLNVESSSYIGDSRIPTVGLTAIIHDQKSYPFMEEFGVIIQPGSSIECAIRRRKIINLPTPYATNCTDGSKLGPLSINPKYAYTKQACLRKCRNDYTVKRCGCTPPELKGDLKAPVCAMNDTVLCVYQSHEEFGISEEKRECQKNCPQPCEHVEYATSFSYGGLQRDAFVEHLMSILNHSNSSSVNMNRAIYEPLLNMTELERVKYIDIFNPNPSINRPSEGINRRVGCNTKLKDNIISLDIYFKDLAYEVIQQIPLYRTGTLIGNLGGMFGLFLGMSCLTLLEFLDFALRRISQLLKNHGREKRTPTSVYVE